MRVRYGSANTGTADTGTADVLVRKGDAVAQDSSLRSFADEDVRGPSICAPSIHVPSIGAPQYWNIPRSSRV